MGHSVTTGITNEFQYFVCDDVPAAGSVRFKRLKVDQPVGNKFFQILGRYTQTTTSHTAPPPMDSFMQMGVM